MHVSRFRYANSVMQTVTRRPLSPASTAQAPPSPLPPDPAISSAQLNPPGSPLNGGNYVALGRNQNYADLTFIQAVVPPTRVGTASADSTLAHIPPPMAPLSLTKLKSVLKSSCPQQGDVEVTATEEEGQGTLIKIGNNKYTINQLYDMDLSSCSTAYESVVDVSGYNEGEILSPNSAYNGILNILDGRLTRLGFQ